MYKTEAFDELEKGVLAALETYSNVHRGSGQKSILTTHLYEKARSVILDYLGLNRRKYVIIFCSKRGAAILSLKIKTGKYKIISSGEIGLPLGVWAIAAEKKALPTGAPFIRGGGTARLISPQWVVWDNVPDRFEPGTPSIINVITFARALNIIKKSGKEVFNISQTGILTAKEILYHDDLSKLSGKELLDELRNTVIGIDTTVPTAEGIKKPINLDNSASTPALAPVWETVCQTWLQSPDIQKNIIEEVRSICARFMGAPLAEYDLIFTNNTTEAINLASENMKLKSSDDSEKVVLSTLLEHSSNDLPWRTATDEVIRLSINSEGFIDLNEMESLLSDYNQKCIYGKKRISIVSVTGASNVLGVYNDIAEISRIAHKYGAQLFVDAAQLVAHRKVEIKGSGVDYLAFSAHKIYAPFGTGVLVVRKGLLKFNAEELEKIRLSGEENTVGIAALGKALLLLGRIGMDLIRKEEQALTSKMLLGMQQINGVTVYGIKDPDSLSFAGKGGVIVFTLEGMMSNRIAEELAFRRGIGIRYGCHCAHILIKHILGLSKGLQQLQRFIVTLFHRLKLPGLARVSLGIGNTENDVDTFLEVLRKMAIKTGSSAKAGQQIKDFIIEAELKVYS